MSDVARRVRSRRQLWAAPGGSHDRMVVLARIALPSMVGAIAATMVLLPLTGGGDVSFVLDKNKVEVAKERLRLQAATYRGEDGRGRPFELQAGSAVQKSSADPVVEIDRLAARINLADGPASFAAPRGRYDMNKQSLNVPGAVTFNGPGGYLLETSDATVDLKSRQMQSGGAVSGTVPQGTFTADQMTADLENRIVRLDGRARLRIVPRRAK
ncbi:LPS export ABC transporter periplasmic protein LptC [uncultured Sphingomonas sp.]|uniref:LPS export ABC transporter periplasmic protein LptC n=1 Tax=uncultured Sphingomonas sp. TaxID=158754 RepID=UPI0035CBFBCC